MVVVMVEGGGTSSGKGKMYGVVGGRMVFVVRSVRAQGHPGFDLATKLRGKKLFASNS